MSALRKAAVTKRRDFRESLDTAMEMEKRGFLEKRSKPRGQASNVGPCNINSLRPLSQAPMVGGKRGISWPVATICDTTRLKETRQKTTRLWQRSICAKFRYLQRSAELRSGAHVGGRFAWKITHEGKSRDEFSLDIGEGDRIMLKASSADEATHWKTQLMQLKNLDQHMQSAGGAEASQEPSVPTSREDINPVLSDAHSLGFFSYHLICPGRLL